MEPRRFNSIMTGVNTKWASDVLNMNINTSKGPDLIDDTKIIELKFSLVKPDRYNYISWKVLEHQMNYDEHQFFAYWGLGVYKLDKDIKNINTTDANLLEKRVLERELFIVDWEWMKQFQPYTQTGKTIISEWDNTIRFPKHSKLPNVIKTYNVKKGKIHLTKKIPEKIFEINFSKNSL